MMKPLLVFLFLLISRLGLTQNPPSKTLSFETLTIDDGLSQGMINWITQDHFGFIWIATKDGLNRYDGSHFVIYRHDPKNKGSLADNFISKVYEDKLHRIWVLSGNYGLDLFDRATETFVHFRHDEKNKHSINSDIVFDLYEDADNNLYITTSAGLSIIKTVSNKNGYNVISFEHINNNKNYCLLFSAHKGEVWMSVLQDSLYRINRIHNNFVRRSIPFVTAIYNTYPFASRCVQSFVYDSVSRYFYMIMSQNLARYDERKNSWSDLPGYKVSAGVISSNSFMDNAGYIWLVAGNRICLYDTKLSKTYILTADDQHQAQMLMNANCMFKDKTGNIWIGTKGYGILKYNSKAEKFHHIGNESITGITENNDGEVVIIRQNYFATLFDNSLKSFTGFVPDTAAGKFTSKFLLQGLQQDAKRNYWLSYDFYPFTKYDPVHKNFTSTPFKASYLFPLYKDRQDNIWTCSSDSMYCFDADLKKIAAWHLPITNSNNFYFLVQSIYQQNDSIFWLATTGGLIQFNKNKNAWKIYVNNANDETTLSSNIIFSLCADPKQPNKFLWAGTNGAGLNCLNMSTGKFTHYTTNDGLPNDVIYGILSDDDGNLWISTNKGLCRFTPPSATNKFSIINYEAKDGLQSNEFNRYAYCKTKDGTLYFGGVNGFNYFNPKELRTNTLPPNIVITDFKIGNRPITIHDDKTILVKPIEMIDKIEVNYEDNMISFDFAAMDFTQSSKNLYQYKMEGFDKSWIQSGTAHSATYTNLDPGTYTFRVKGSNSDGVWNETGTSIELTILAPWYMTWWFRTLVVIFIMITIYIFYRYRLSQALKLQSIRSKIASDLHDEIGSSLSSISIFSDVAKEQLEGHPVSTLVNKINNYSRESMEAMSDIVWMINANNDHFENITSHMRELAGELSEAKKFVLHFEMDEQLNTIKLGMNERKNLWLIYKEALNNSAKYSDAKNVWVQILAQHRNIAMKIKDDGKGFDTGEMSNGNGLKNMASRAEAMNGIIHIVSSPNNGTSIELKFRI